MAIRDLLMGRPPEIGRISLFIISMVRKNIVQISRVRIFIVMISTVRYL